MNVILAKIELEYLYNCNFSIFMVLLKEGETVEAVNITMHIFFFCNSTYYFMQY